MGREEREEALIRIYYMIKVFISINGKRISGILTSILPTELKP